MACPCETHAVIDLSRGRAVPNAAAAASSLDQTPSRSKGLSPGTCDQHHIFLGRVCSRRRHSLPNLSHSSSTETSTTATTSRFWFHLLCTDEGLISCSRSRNATADAACQTVITPPCRISLANSSAASTARTERWQSVTTTFNPSKIYLACATSVRRSQLSCGSFALGSPTAYRARRSLETTCCILTTVSSGVCTTHE